MRLSCTALLQIGIVLGTFLSPALPAGAFLSSNTLEGGGHTFTFSLVGNPQWEFTTAGGDVYRGSRLDAARFEGDYGLSLSDEAQITLNGAPIEAKLKGRIDVNCLAGRVTLKDATSRRTFTVVYGDGVSLIACNFL